MTSFAFILGVVPLVLATGAGASARKSIGITVFSGMIASTCLAVLFVPAFFVVMQRFEKWLGERKNEGGPASGTADGTLGPFRRNILPILDTRINHSFLSGALQTSGVRLH